MNSTDLKAAVKKTGVEIRKGDMVLLYTGHWNKTRGTPAYATDNPGLTKEACELLFTIVTVGIFLLGLTVIVRAIY